MVDLAYVLIKVVPLSLQGDAEFDVSTIRLTFYVQIERYHAVGRA